MFVIKRDGKKEGVRFDKITSRIKKLCYGLDDQFVDPVELSQIVCRGLTTGMTTVALDELASETAVAKTSTHPDWGTLAARIAVSNLHKQTEKVFSKVIQLMHSHVDKRSNKSAPMISDDVYAFVMENADKLDSVIVHDRDFQYSYFGFSTLRKGYLMRADSKILERPQHMIMRVACGIHFPNLEDTLKSYEWMSQGFFTHATPTLFNASTPKPQLSSCFLMTMTSDSIDGIFETLKQCAMISKYAGGIGLSIDDIRSSGSYIRGTNGTSNGLIPMLRVFNNTARYVDQGGGKRKGSFAVYLSPYHPDIFQFLDLKKNDGSEEMRARDLFYAMWLPDLFMRRVADDGFWSLMCPNEAPGLADVWGDEFDKLYCKYEQDKTKVRKVVKARSIWAAIIESQVQTGLPYIGWKDTCNRRSNQKNLGTIRCSNLCTEIIQFSSPEETAVCNLASIALPMFVDSSEKLLSNTRELLSSIFIRDIVHIIMEHMEKDEPAFDHDMLYQVTQTIVGNLNHVIDKTYYPTEQSKNSNLKHRPLGLGIQGLTDVFVMMRYPYESEKARILNKEIFETIYFAALSASVALAEKDGPYSSFKGSPASLGILQFDYTEVKPSDRWDWASLKLNIQKVGLRNSLLVAPMPTASTSQILGNTECIEIPTSNLYMRGTLAGTFPVVSRHLLNDLIKRGIWNNEMKEKLVAHNGSVQDMDEIPQDLKDLYKTTWEIGVKHQINLAADRGAFIDQAQSFNIHMPDPDYSKMTSLMFYAWKKGLKTLYYTRTRSSAQPIQFTVDPKLSNSIIKKKELKNLAPQKQCKIDDPDCVSCGS